MKWLTEKGNIRSINPKKYTISWTGKSASNFQKLVKRFFFLYWADDVVGEEVTLPYSGGLRVDIMNFTKKIAIECNGPFHFGYNSHFHGNNIKKYQNQIDRDVLKEKLLEMNDFMVIEIYEKNMPLTEKWVLKTFGDILF